MQVFHKQATLLFCLDIRRQIEGSSCYFSLPHNKQYKAHKITEAPYSKEMLQAYIFHSSSTLHIFRSPLFEEALSRMTASI